MPTTNELSLHARQMRDELQDELKARDITGVVLVGVPLPATGNLITAAGQHAAPAQYETFAKDLVGAAVEMLLDEYPPDVIPNLIFAYAKARLLSLQRRADQTTKAQVLNNLLSLRGQSPSPSDAPPLPPRDKADDDTP